MTTKPGFGVEDVHLRQDASLLVERLGRPTKRHTSTPLREYWLYPDQGVECIVSTKTSRVLSIFLKAGIVTTSPRQPDLLGLSQQEIISRFGQPDLEGGDLTLNTGDYVGRWFSYVTGIGFHFDRQGYVETVSVFAAKRRPQQLNKGSAQHATSFSNSVAALRRG